MSQIIGKVTLIIRRMSSLHFSIILLTFLSHFSEANVLNGRAQGGKRWAVIVAGARKYNNYFSQANACHAYQVLRGGGIPAENIIHFNFDDIANSGWNPVKGNLINTLNGSNVYEGCVIDYRRKDVNPDVFIAVLTGNKTAVEGLTKKKGKVLESGPDDEIFIYMTDHGWWYQFEFIEKPLNAIVFVNALKTMYRRKMYNQMVIYMDACHAGSMFEGLLPDDINIYAVTSTKAGEVGFMSCYDDSRGIFLSSVYSYTWMYDTEEFDRNQKTLYQLYETAYNTSTHFPNKCVSHPQQYGNVSLNKYFIARFMGDDKGTNKSHYCDNFPDVDEKTLEMLRNEFEFPFEEDVLSLHFLQRPPIDMVGVATLIRRLLSKTLTEGERESLKAQLDYSLKIQVIASELMKAVDKQAIKSVKNVPLRFINVDKIDFLHCFNKAMENIRSGCPNLEPQQFPFINRNLKSLINWCKGFPSEVIMNAITTSTSKVC